MVRSLRSPRLGTPVPFQAAFEHNPRTAAPHIGANTQVHQKIRREFPVSAKEQLMHLRLSARTYIDALDLTVIFDRRRKGLAPPAHQSGWLEVPSMSGARTVQGAFEHGIEHDLPPLKLAVQNRTQLHSAGIFFVTHILK